MTVVRNGARVDETFATGDDGDGNAVMGIYVDPTFDLPIDVTVRIDTVGGPSAGMMFSLGIMDKLTKAGRTQRRQGCGHRHHQRERRRGAHRRHPHEDVGRHDAGSEYFLAPVENCNEVVGQHSGRLERFLGGHTG